MEDLIIELKYMLKTAEKNYTESIGSSEENYLKGVRDGLNLSLVFMNKTQLEDNMNNIFNS